MRDMYIYILHLDFLINFIYKLFLLSKGSNSIIHVRSKGYSLRKEAEHRIYNDLHKRTICMSVDYSTSRTTL